MFRSIRWRLVAGSFLLTALTVGAVGVLALALVQRSMERQELAYLTDNAQAVASQAQAYMSPVVQIQALEQLARSSAFMSDAQVSILDAKRQLLINSGQSARLDELAMVISSGPAGWGPLTVHTENVEEQPAFLLNQWPQGAPDEGDALPPGMVEVVIVERSSGTWGNEIRFTEESWEIIPPKTLLEEVAIQETPEIPPDEVEGPVPDDTAQAPQTAQAAPEALRSSLAVTVPIGPEQEPLGYVTLSNPPDRSGEALSTVRRSLTLAGGGAALLAAAAGLLMGRGLTAPLQALSAAAGRMSDGELSVRAPVRSQDEIGELARRFNQMAEQVEASFARLEAERDGLRRFIGDASHELRTPITALKNFNELLRGAASDDPEARVEFLTESAEQLERLEWITTNLLDLSRWDAGLVALEVESHDLGELISAAAAPLKTVAQEREIALALVSPEKPVALRCDQARLTLALSNLLDNALKFTPPGGRVEIGGRAGREGVLIWVADNGQGIEAADLPHVFKRFFRGRNQEQPGSGLGLAIVQSVVQAHGGEVAVESRPGKGSRFEIVLPA